jgi:hypothetical protein
MTVLMVFCNIFKISSTNNKMYDLRGVNLWSQCTGPERQCMSYITLQEELCVRIACIPL